MIARRGSPGWIGVAAVAAVIGVLAVAQSSGASTPRAAAARAHATARRKAPPAGCFETGSFDGRTVRVPVRCPAPQAGRCYLQSRFDGRSYRVRIDCAPGAKRSGGGSPGHGATPTSGSSGASGSSGTGGPGGTGATGSTGASVDWSRASAARCDDGSTPTTDDAGDFSCADDSTPFCVDTSAVLLVDPGEQSVVCLPEQSIPATGVCDDGSTPGVDGTDLGGAPICADGDDAYTPSDYTIGVDTCDDGSNPGDGGQDSEGNPLCADGSYPAAGQ